MKNFLRNLKNMFKGDIAAATTSAHSYAGHAWEVTDRRIVELYRKIDALESEVSNLRSDLAGNTAAVLKSAKLASKLHK